MISAGTIRPDCALITILRSKQCWSNNTATIEYSRTMNLSTSCNDAIATHSMMQHSSVQPNVKFYCAELWAGTLQHAVSKNIYKQSQLYREREWTHTMGSERKPYFDRVRMFKPNESDHTENKKCGTFKNNEKGPMCASNMEFPLA